MKRMMMLVLLLGFVAFGAGAACAAAVEMPADCVHCGMNRTTFSHSRMLIEYADGTSVGTCSINCVAVDLAANPGKKVKAVKVADYNTKELIDAKTATWVMGGSKKGVMTMEPKWAFAAKADAEKFVKEFGGTIVTYDAALKAASKSPKMGKKKPVMMPHGHEEMHH